MLDAAETSEADIQDDIEFALIQMKAETLNKIEEALRRLEEGTFGYCFECGEEISERRLRALPFAVRCKDCEEARELAQQRERLSRSAAAPRRCSSTSRVKTDRPRRAPMGASGILRRPDGRLTLRAQSRCPSSVARLPSVLGPRTRPPMSDRDEPVVVEDAPTAERLDDPSGLPVLPLRDTVLFPNSFMPLAVAREASVRLIDEATTSGRMIGVFTQREASVEEPLQDDLYPIGTATHIHKMFKLPDGSLRLIVQGLARVRLDRIVQTRPYLRAAVSLADEVLRDEDHLEIDALQRNIKSNFQQVVSLSPLLSDDLQALAGNITDPGKLADFIASSLTTIGTPVKQEVLETLDIRARMDVAQPAC